MMSLAFEQVGFAYGDKPVLGGVSCEFAPGAITAILGPNGAGKTTLLRLGLGVLTPGDGRVTLDGIEVRSMPHRHRAARIAYIAQRPSVSFAFCVGQVVAMGRYHANGSSHRSVSCPDRIAAVLDRVDLLDRVGDPVGQLSAGQQQRVALARALVQLDCPATPGSERRPTCVLLADEPMSAQDPRHQAQTVRLLRELAHRGVAVVVVLHDFTLVPRLADRAVLLDEHGSVAAAGSIEAVLRSEVLAPVYGVGFRRVELGDQRWAMLCDDDPPLPDRAVESTRDTAVNTPGANDL